MPPPLVLKQHTPLQLKLAACCNPDMNQHERRRQLRALAWQQGDLVWFARTARAAKEGASLSDAMLMLDDYEQPERVRQRMWANMMVVLAILIVTGSIAVAIWRARKHPYHTQ